MAASTAVVAAALLLLLVVLRLPMLLETPVSCCSVDGLGDDAGVNVDGDVTAAAAAVAAVAAAPLSHAPANKPALSSDRAFGLILSQEPAVWEKLRFRPVVLVDEPCFVDAIGGDTVASPPPRSA